MIMRRLCHDNCGGDSELKPCICPLAYERGFEKVHKNNTLDAVSLKVANKFCECNYGTLKEGRS